MFSSLLNVDSSREESHHRKKKQIASKTQRRFDTFDDQTASKEFMYNVLLKAMRQCDFDLEDKFECNFDDEDFSNESESESTTIDTSDSSSKRKNNGSKFKLTFDYTKECVTGQWLSRAMKDVAFNYPENVMSSIYNKLSGFNNGQVGQRIKTIQCFTEYRKNTKDTQVYRCCPDYRKMGDWFDWASVTWDDYGDLDAQLLLFMDMTSMSFESVGNDPQHNEPHDGFGYSVGVLLHSINSTSSSKQRKPALSTNQSSRVVGPVTRICKFSKMEDEYQLVDICAIKGPSFVITDKWRTGTNQHEPGNASHVCIILPRYEWSKYFIDYTSEVAANDAATRKNTSIEEDDETYPYES